MTILQFRLIIAHFCVAYLSCSSLGSRESTIDGPKIPPIAKYFTTKGRYEEVNPYLIDDILAVNQSILKNVAPSAECRAIHLSALIRHGTRYPTTRNVQKMRQLYDLIVQMSPDKDNLHEIKTQWKMWYTDDMDGRLVQKGVSDLTHLAVRLSKLLPSLISAENLRGGRVKFMTSSKHRCVNSTMAFKRGLTEHLNIEDEEFDHEVNDALMRFFDQCPRLVEGYGKSALSEVDKFWSSPEMKRVQEKIADRLSVPHNNITADMAEAAFYLCAYEFAIKTINSPWCQLIDEQDAQVLEYANDLKQYWKRGYGHDINSKASCILFHDVFSRLDKAASEARSGNNVTEAVTIQVGHGETLLPLLTLLGFFKDSEPLTSTNYATQRQRVFRTSLFLPYAANLVLVLYDCEDGIRLQALLNERPLTIAGLTTDDQHQEAWAPLYQKVRERYMDLLQGCDFEKECQLFPSN